MLVRFSVPKLHPPRSKAWSTRTRVARTSRIRLRPLCRPEKEPPMVLRPGVGATAVASVVVTVGPARSGSSPHPLRLLPEYRPLTPLNHPDRFHHRPSDGTDRSRPT